MKQAKIIFLITIFTLALNGSIFARTRNNVIQEAIAYSEFNWDVGANNILDIYDHKNSTTSVPIGGHDGVDDRAFKWDVKKATWVYSTANWPFAIGDNVTGEAYAWAGYRNNPFALWGADTTAKFSERLASPGKWIAGRRPEHVLPSGYAGFTGMDCSGLAGNALDINRLADDGYKFNTEQLIGQSLKISTTEVKAGDIIAKAGDHVALFTGWIGAPSKARIIHASYFHFSEGNYKYRVVRDSATLSGSAVSGTLPARPADGYYIYSPFPQFSWTAPTKDNPDFNPLTQAIELTIKSKNDIIKSSITLVIDEGLAAEKRIKYDAPGVTLTPNTNSTNIAVHYAIPVEDWPASGHHTITAYAATILNLEDNSIMDFNVLGGSVPPRIAYRDQVNLLTVSGSLNGNNTPETALWLHTAGVRLQFDAAQASLDGFRIYQDDTLEHLAYAKPFIPGTKTAVIGDALEGFADRTGYYAAITDKLGNTTSSYFHLDKNGPIIESTATAMIDAAGTGFYFDVAGRATDGVSGLGGDVLLSTESVPTLEYSGPSYPPGPGTVTYSFTGITEGTKLVAFDRAGWIGIKDLLVNNNVAELRISTSGSFDGRVGDSGVMVRTAWINATGAYAPGYPLEPGTALLDQPTGGKVELWAFSEDMSGNNTIPLEHGYEPVTSRKLLELSGAGSDSGTFNLPMRQGMRLYLLRLPNTNNVRYTHWVDTDGDGIKETYREDVFPPGNFYPVASAGATVAYNNIAAHNHFNEWLPAGPVRSVTAGRVKVTIYNVTAGGNITVDTARRTLKQPGYKMAESDIVYELKTAAIYDGPVEIEVGGFCSGGNTPGQTTRAVILHCSQDYATCSQLVTTAGGCTAKATVDRLSPFALMLPIDDITAPRTVLELIGETAVLNGELWITTETYLDLAADDTAGVGDITGVATTYCLLDYQGNNIDLYNSSLDC